MDGRDDRTIQMIGCEGMDALKSARVLVVGVGGVGSYAAEAVARAGVGTLAVMDGDTVSVSNMNRQLVALASTVGRSKAEVMAERIADINPDASVRCIPFFYGRDPATKAASTDETTTKAAGADETTTEAASTGETTTQAASAYEATTKAVNSEAASASEQIRLDEFDWIIDAIDDVDAKVALIKNALEAGVNIVSAMGAAGKFETCFKSADIAKTNMCPLAKVMRRRLRAEGIEHLPVVYSEEKPIPRNGELGSLSYVPASMGLELAGYVIKQICEVTIK